MSENELPPGERGITRRRLIRDSGIVGLALAGSGALGPGRSLGAVLARAEVAAAYTLTPEEEEGPFYVAIEKIRKNIVMGRARRAAHSSGSRS